MKMDSDAGENLMEVVVELVNIVKHYKNPANVDDIGGGSFNYVVATIAADTLREFSDELKEMLKAGYGKDDIKIH